MVHYSESVFMVCIYFIVPRNLVVVHGYILMVAMVTYLRGTVSRGGSSFFGSP